MSAQENTPTLYPELNGLRRTLWEVQGQYSEKKPALDEALSLLKPKERTADLDTFQENAVSPISKRIPNVLYNKMRNLKTAISNVDDRLSDSEARLGVMDGSTESDIVDEFKSLLLDSAANILERMESLDRSPFGVAAIELQYELQGETELFRLGLNGLLESVEFMPGVVSSSGSLFAFIDDLSAAMAPIADRSELLPAWELVSQWIKRFDSRSELQAKLAGMLPIAEFEYSDSKNMDLYAAGDVMAKPTMKVGAFQAAKVLKGRLPSCLALDSSGQIVVADTARIFPGEFTGLVVEVENTLGFKSSIILQDIIFKEDIESSYTVFSPIDVSAASNDMLVAYPVDPDGGLAGAELTEGTFPTGLRFNTSTGEIHIANVIRLIPGSYSIGVLTVDQEGGQTKHTLAIEITNGQTGTATFVFEQPLSRTLYVGIRIGYIQLQNAGQIVGIALRSGTLPAGLTVNSQGQFIVTDPNRVPRGTYNLLYSITTTYRNVIDVAVQFTL